MNLSLTPIASFNSPLLEQLDLFRLIGANILGDDIHKSSTTTQPNTADRALVSEAARTRSEGVQARLDDHALQEEAALRQSEPRNSAASLSGLRPPRSAIATRQFLAEHLREMASFSTDNEAAEARRQPSSRENGLHPSTQVQASAASQTAPAQGVENGVNTVPQPDRINSEAGSSLTDQQASQSILLQPETTAAVGTGSSSPQIELGQSGPGGDAEPVAERVVGSETGDAAPSLSNSHSRSPAFPGAFEQPNTPASPEFDRDGVEQAEHDLSGPSDGESLDPTRGIPADSEVTTQAGPFDPVQRDELARTVDHEAATPFAERLHQLPEKEAASETLTLSAFADALDATVTEPTAQVRTHASDFVAGNPLEAGLASLGFQALDVMPMPERAGVIASFILNAHFMPGWPPPRPIELPEMMKAHASLAERVSELSEAELEKLLYLSKLGLTPGQLERILRLMARARKRSTFFDTLAAALTNISAVLEALRDEAAAIMDELATRHQVAMPAYAGGKRKRIAL